jgi:hypothetical protein
MAIILCMSGAQEAEEFYWHALRSAGHELYLAHDLLQLTRACSGRAPDIIVLSDSIPFSRLHQAVAVLRADCPAVPIVLLQLGNVTPALAVESVIDGEEAEDFAHRVQALIDVRAPRRREGSND